LSAANKLKYLWKSKNLNIRPLNRDDLTHISEIDVTEDGDRIYRSVDGRLVADSEPWHRPRWDAGECQRRVAKFALEPEDIHMIRGLVIPQQDKTHQKRK